VEQSHLAEVLNGAPFIGDEVRLVLRRAHASRATTPGLIEKASAATIAPEFADVAARWVEFSAGTVSEAEIRSVSDRWLGVGFPTPETTGRR
jgi:hypothetical protein